MRRTRRRQRVRQQHAFLAIARQEQEGGNDNYEDADAAGNDDDDNDDDDPPVSCVSRKRPRTAGMVPPTTAFKPAAAAAALGDSPAGTRQESSSSSYSTTIATLQAALRANRTLQTTLQNRLQEILVQKEANRSKAAASVWQQQPITIQNDDDDYDSPPSLVMRSVLPCSAMPREIQTFLPQAFQREQENQKQQQQQSSTKEVAQNNDNEIEEKDQEDNDDDDDNNEEEKSKNSNNKKKERTRASEAPSSSDSHALLSPREVSKAKRQFVFAADRKWTRNYFEDPMGWKPNTQGKNADTIFRHEHLQPPLELSQPLAIVITSGTATASSLSLPSSSSSIPPTKSVTTSFISKQNQQRQQNPSNRGLTPAQGQFLLELVLKQRDDGNAATRDGNQSKRKAWPSIVQSLKDKFATTAAAAATVAATTEKSSSSPVVTTWDCACYYMQHQVSLQKEEQRQQVASSVPSPPNEKDPPTSSSTTNAQVMTLEQDERLFRFFALQGPQYVWDVPTCGTVAASRLLTATTVARGTKNEDGGKSFLPPVSIQSLWTRSNATSSLNLKLTTDPYWNKDMEQRLLILMKIYHDSTRKTTSNEADSSDHGDDDDNDDDGSSSTEENSKGDRPSSGKGSSKKRQAAKIRKPGIKAIAQATAHFPNRTRDQIFHKWQRSLDPTLHHDLWTAAEDQSLKRLVQQALQTAQETQKAPPRVTDLVRPHMPHRKPHQIYQRWLDIGRPEEIVAMDAWQLLETKSPPVLVGTRTTTAPGTISTNTTLTPKVLAPDQFRLEWQNLNET